MKIPWPQVEVVERTGGKVLFACGHVATKIHRDHPMFLLKVGDWFGCLNCFLESEKGRELIDDFVVRYNSEP